MTREVAMTSGSGKTVEDARRAAVVAALTAQQRPDGMISYKVVEIRGKAGGIAGLDEVEVIIDAVRT
jgi:hypothetical protein